MIRLIIQFGFSTLLLLFSTSVAWYEGSAILDKSLEWKYTPHLLHSYCMEKLVR